LSASGIDIGDVVQLEACFSNMLGSPVIPASVVCRVQNGQGSEVATYTYGGGTLLLSSPTFTVQQPITASLGWGHWRYRFEGSLPAAAEEFTFFVRDSAFD
jgi:hypothetical protein